MILALLGIGLFCLLLIRFAIYALPAFVGISIGFWALKTGAGAFGAICAGILAGSITFGIGQVVFTTSRSIVTRTVVAGLYVVPAIWAGYTSILQLSEFAGTTSSLWRHAFAIVGSLSIGYMAFTRLATPLEDIPAPMASPSPQPVETETSVTKLTARHADARASRRWSRRA